MKGSSHDRSAACKRHFLGRQVPGIGLGLGLGLGLWLGLGLGLGQLGCGTIPADPVRVSDGDSAVEFVPANTTLRLLTFERELVRFPADAWQIGTVEQLDERASLDPYWLEYGDEVLSPSEPADLRWHTVETIAIVSATATELELALQLTDGQRASLRIAPSGPGRFAAVLLPEVRAERQVAFVRLRPRVDAQEAFYGLGGWADEVNQRGKVRPMQQEIDLLESKSNELRVPVPLLWARAAGACLSRAAARGCSHVANKQPDLVETPTAPGRTAQAACASTSHWRRADRPDGALLRRSPGRRSSRLRGRWDPWIWRNENKDQAQVLDDIRKIRELDLATSAIWIDRPYATTSTASTLTRRASPIPGDDRQDPRCRSAPGAVARAVPGAGQPRSAAGEAAGSVSEVERGCCSTAGASRSTSPTRRRWRCGKTAWIATSSWASRASSSTTARMSWSGSARRARLAVRRWQRERTMHHTYQLLYHRAYAELLAPDGGFLLCRTGRFGDQKNVSVIWPGDMDASFTRHREPFKGRDGKTVQGVGGLPATVVMGLNLGVSGFPFFGADTGGYRHSPPDKELYIRWFQQTALSTVMQVGDASSQPPWEFTADNGRDAETLDLYREFARLHLRLFPYEWTLVTGLADGGRPILRPVGLAYPNLRTHPSDEYLFGDDLLVAPVLQRGARSREVLLPPGTWVDFTSGQSYAGDSERTVQVDAPLRKLPLLVRAGALIPLLRPTIDTLAPASDAAVESFVRDPGPLWVMVVPGREAEPVHGLRRHTPGL
jgi:alpha-D-xyloside xylohydrolase